MQTCVSLALKERVKEKIKIPIDLFTQKNGQNFYDYTKKCAIV
jgi:hypothetical protein